MDMHKKYNNHFLSNPLTCKNIFDQSFYQSAKISVYYKTNILSTYKYKYIFP